MTKLKLGEEFTKEDIAGLEAALRHDYLQHTIEDVTKYLRNGDMLMLRYSETEVELSLLVNGLAWPGGSELYVMCIWGKGYKKGIEGLINELKVFAKERGYKWVSASFRSSAMLKLSGARQAYVLGVVDV